MRPFQRRASDKTSLSSPPGKEGRGAVPPPYESEGRTAGVETPFWATKPASAGSSFSRIATRAGGFGSPERHFNAGMYAPKPYEGGGRGRFSPRRRAPMLPDKGVGVGLAQERVGQALPDGRIGVPGCPCKGVIYHALAAPSSTSKRSREGTLLMLLGLLLLLAGAVLAREEHTRSREECIAREFQILLHGTGLGPAVDLSGCAFAFDPRLAGRCPQDLGPLPLGGAYCPYHTLSPFSTSSLQTGGTDAHSP
jgi:hypothetical protein